ncbi:unnamed protein product [Ectocarpus fasciculatus]
MFKILTAAATAMAVTAEAPPVKVEFYMESQCPYCQDFAVGPLERTLEKPDMAAIMDLKIVAYGNTKKNDDGSFDCQHGVGECESDVYESCVQYKLSGDINSIESGDTTMAAWPFILCMEEADGAPSEAESCFASTMNSTALSWSTVEDCFKNEADVVQNAAMKATPDHDYVPWVLVDGVLLENTNMLTKAVCDAYTGTPPASCRFSGEAVVTGKAGHSDNH